MTQILVDFKITMYISEGGRTKLSMSKGQPAWQPLCFYFFASTNAGLVGILVCHFTLHKLDMKIRNYEKDRQNTIKYSAGKPRWNRIIILALEFRYHSELFSIRKYLWNVELNSQLIELFISLAISTKLENYGKCSKRLCIHTHCT